MAIDAQQICRRYFSRHQQNLESHGMAELPFSQSSDLQLAVAVDTLVENTHFTSGTAPDLLACKALAVNLSDLAAMGAEPLALSLAIAIPAEDEAWLDSFSQALYSMAEEYSMQILDCQITEAPLTISVQVYGKLPKGQAIRRDGARPGDRIYVTGTLGDAGLALLQQAFQLPLTTEQQAHIQQQLDCPQPRLKEGLLLRGLANSAIDVSDGLVADLGHILEASQVSARVQVEKIPLSDAMQAAFDAVKGWHLPLSAGDDYELCFTVPADKEATMLALFKAADCQVTYIGEIEGGEGLKLEDAQGNDYPVLQAGYEHFTGRKNEH